MCYQANVAILDRSFSTLYLMEAHYMALKTYLPRLSARSRLIGFLGKWNIILV